MRNGQNKRMRGRNRNKGHHHGHHHNPLTRVYESNGPEVKIRGTAHHVAEKYLQLARDATASGDYVTAENYNQHAEHYFRLIAAAQEQFRQQNPYYQPQPTAPGGDSNEGSFDDGDEEGAQPSQGQPNYGSQQQPYPQREHPQPYGGQPQQSRPQQQQQNFQQQQNYQQQNYQPQHQQQQHYPPPPQQQQQPIGNFDSNEGLPSFITGGQPQQPQPAQPHQGNPNGYDSQADRFPRDNQGGDRYPRHRRRRHRGGGGPRPDMMPQQMRGDDGPDDSRPGSN
jgi:hypothetical protein